MKLAADAKRLLGSIEGGERESTGGKRERANYACCANATFRKERRLSIRPSSNDLAHGLPEDDHPESEGHEAVSR